MESLWKTLPNARDPPYVILTGGVGQGKSTLLEKLTGQTGHSSAADESVTKCSKAYYTPNKTLLICDTPGSNPVENKLDHNMNIAHAMNTYPVSLIVIVVKGDCGRIDSVIDVVRKYAESFADFVDHLAVCVTHMDKATWDKYKFCRLLEQDIGLGIVIFSDIQTPGQELETEIKKVCKQRPLNLMINSENFLKYFKISNGNIKILKTVKDEVAKFEYIKQIFYSALQAFQGQEQMDMVFEFQTWIAEEIILAQKRITEANGFDFINANGPQMADSAGHLANLTNQLKLVLHDVRVHAQKYHQEHGLAQLRVCPHCNLVWTKLEGCDGATTCGNLMSNYFDGRFAEFFSFKFVWEGGNLKIVRAGKKKLVKEGGIAKKDKKVGCGGEITWENMKPYPMPKDLELDLRSFNVAAVNTNDINILPRPAQRAWDNIYEDKMAKMDRNIIGH